MLKTKSKNKILFILIATVVLCTTLAITISADNLGSIDNNGGVELPVEPFSTAYFYSASGQSPQFISIHKSGEKVSVIYSFAFAGSPRTNNLQIGDIDYLIDWLSSEFDYMYNNLTTNFISSTSGISRTFKFYIDYYDCYDEWLECYINQYISGCASIIQEMEYDQLLSINQTLNQQIDILQSANQSLQEQNSTKDIIISDLQENILDLQEALPIRYSEGYNNGYQIGYNDGMTESDIYINGLNSVFSAPSYMLYNIFNFEIFGVNVFSFILMILSLIIIAWLIKRFI